MIRELVYFLKHGPKVKRLQAEFDRVGFMKRLVVQADKDGYADLRTELVGDLTGDVLEVGTGTGATMPYYRESAVVTALEPDDEFRAEAENAARIASAQITVVPGTGESLPFEDESFDTVVTATVLCSVTSMSQTLADLKRVLRPGGQAAAGARTEQSLAGWASDECQQPYLAVGQQDRVQHEPQAGGSGSRLRFHHCRSASR